MRVPRPFALIRTHDQWLRASHDRTALEGEVVQLYWRDSLAESDAAEQSFTERGAGLAFDGHCRLYHSVPKEGRIERLLWAAQDPLQPAGAQPVPVNLFETDGDDRLGDFTLAGAQPNALLEPRGLTVDAGERLFVAESGARRILIYDLRSNRLLRRVQLAAAPVDLAAHGRTVYALLVSPPGLLKLDARNDPRALELPAGMTEPARIALSPAGELFILERAGKAQSRVVNYGRPDEVLDVRFATDIEFQTGDPLLAQVCANDNHVLAVARRPGEDFLRFCVGGNGAAELPPLKARGYDGLGLVRTPDGRIGFWTERGFRQAVGARLRYLPSGGVTTFRLDSHEFHTVWGRVFLDACIPKDTDVVLRCVTADEPPDEPAMPLSPPLNTAADVPHKELSPPLPPLSLALRLERAPAQALHRRETGRELPWVRPAENDPFETYEAPVISAPGRYLWVRLDLSGNTRATPRVKALRAEYPTHDYLSRIPKTFSRDEQVASFLRRYLATFEGLLGELEAKSDARASLLDARSAPAEILPWLAGFLGLTLDERMARAPRPGGRVEDVRRELIREATWLFHFRGTVAGLRRFVEIYLGVRTILVEKFRVRGMGGALLEDSVGLSSSSILGAGFRIGGAIGEDETQMLGGTIEDAFETHAHRFALIIPAELSSEQRSVVEQILELHRPAHTLVEVCTVGAGMRVGRGLHIALTSVIGRSGGFTQLQLGNALLGRGAILGSAEAGTVIGGSRLGGDSRVG
jgi:phage tail-like protein